MVARILISCLLAASGLTVAAADLPAVALTPERWTCGAGTVIEDGVATLTGDPEGYPRVTLTLPGADVAGKTIRFAAMVKTAGIVPGREIAYASPKLKVLDSRGRSAKAVNNFGAAERADWERVHVDVTLPADWDQPIVLELGLQLCRGTLSVKDVTIAAVEPWRWRFLDAGHQSYYGK